MTLPSKPSLCLLGSLLAGTVSAATPPNVILFLMDDMGINDIGAYTWPSTANPWPASGPTPIDNSAYNPLPAPNSAWDSVAGVSRTPRIDSLADEGVRLTSFYAASPVCSPSRSAIMTGSYPLRVGINFVYYPNAGNGLNPNEVTLPELLKTAGYATCMVGKWHLGDRTDFLPTRHGFDRYRGLLYSNDMWVGNSGTWPDLNLMDDESPAPTLVTGSGGTIANPVNTPTEQSFLLEAMTETALEFIETAHTNDEPFFVYYAPHAPHTPVYPHPDFDGSTGLGNYYDVVAEIDARVGEMLDLLDTLGIENDTLVIFTSDNGPWVTRYDFTRRQYPENAVGSAYPFRGYKHETWEGGQRVPFLARYPGVIPAGLETDEVAAHFDLYTTIAAWAGVTPLADGRVIDGLDVRPLLTSGAASPHDFFAYYDSNNSTPQGIRDDDWKLRLGKLYDLPADIQESIDVNNPAVESILSGKLSAFDSSLKSTSRSTASSKSVSIELSSNTVHVPESGTATINVWLSSAANTTVTITAFMGDPDLEVQSGGTLVFTSGNFNIPQTVTFSFNGDLDLEEGGALFRANSSATNLREIFVIENDNGRLSIPGILVTETDGTTEVSEDGTADTYALVLLSEPLDDVLVTVSPDLQLLADGTALPTVLTFTSADWDIPQFVTVTAVDDFSPEGSHTDMIFHTISSADPAYAALDPFDISVSISDNDTDPDAPNAPALAADLVLWLKDPANGYQSGTWSDSSGQGNHVADLSAGGGYGGLSSLTSLNPLSGLFAGQSIPAVHIADNGLMGNPGLLPLSNNFAGLTLVAIYQSTGDSGETRAIGIGSKTFSGSGSARFNLAADASLRYDNGNNLGNAANHGDFLLLRAARLDSGIVTDWINNGAGLVRNIAPTSTPSNGSIPNPTSSDAFFLGELASTVGVSDASSSDYKIVQVAVYQAALTDQQISNLTAWMASNPQGASLAEPQVWREFYFSTRVNSGDAADLADPDHDGIQNIFERAFRTSPVDPADRFAPGFSVVQAEENMYPQIQYRRVRGGTGSTGVDYSAGGLTYSVQVNPGLSPEAWTSGPGVVIPVGEAVVSPDGRFETVTVRSATPMGNDTGKEPKQFLRLAISSQ